MKFAVCESTTPRASFAEDVALYSAAGAEGIGIVERKLPPDDDAASIELVRASGLDVSVAITAAASILPRTPGASSVDAYEAQLRALCDGIERLAAFKPAVCLCMTGPRGSYSASVASELAVRGLREAGRTARRVGVPLALEPIHRSISADWSLVSGIDDSLELIDAAGGGLEIGLLYDVWHLWDVPDAVETARRVAPRVAAVHVNDRKEPTRNWQDRTFPGDGVIDLQRLLGALETGGFEGWYELELLFDEESELAALDPAEVVARGRDGFLRAWHARGP